MSRTEYRFDGLDALEQQLSRMIEEEYPAEFRALVIQIAYELQGKVKEKTPRKTGRLQDSWNRRCRATCGNGSATLSAPMTCEEGHHGHHNL